MLLKNIQDIKIVNGSWSVTRTDILSLNKIVKDIQTLTYNGEQLTKYESVENGKFPPFIQVFYSLIFQYKRIPTEDLFFSEYLKWICNGNPKDETFYFEEKQYLTLGLKARLLRTYPSLIRDIHFYYLLLESNKFETVTYSLRADYYDGIDIMVNYKNYLFAVSIHINTQRGKDYKMKKAHRHNYNDINEIILNVNFDDLTLLGKIRVLNNIHMQELLEKMQCFSK